MTVVTKVGGFDRTCLVIDLCTHKPLTLIEIAQIEDKLSMVLSTDILKHNNIAKVDIIGPNRFNLPLRNALRLE